MVYHKIPEHLDVGMQLNTLTLAYSIQNKALKLRNETLQCLSFHQTLEIQNESTLKQYWGLGESFRDSKVSLGTSLRALLQF